MRAFPTKNLMTRDIPTKNLMTLKMAQDFFLVHDNLWECVKFAQ
jgi:hypothetical protein